MYKDARAPASFMEFKCHPLEPMITKEINSLFTREWPFKNQEEFKKFRDSGLSRALCYTFPDARDDRIHLVCLFWILVFFFVDDQLEDMSLEAGTAYVERMVAISTDRAKIDQGVPMERMMSSLWQQMRVVDPEKSTGIMENTTQFWRSQVHRDRTTSFGLKDYLDYRYRDTAAGLYSLLIQFGMDVQLSVEEINATRELDLNQARYITFVNDIYSWGKELKKSQESASEGSALCSSVKIISDQLGVSFSSAKRILQAICQELELKQMELAERIVVENPQLLGYCQAIGHLMKGTEVWSKESLRYVVS